MITVRKSRRKEQVVNLNIDGRKIKIYRMSDLSTILDRLMIPTLVLPFVSTVKFHRVPWVGETNWCSRQVDFLVRLRTVSMQHPNVQYKQKCRRFKPTELRYSCLKYNLPNDLGTNLKLYKNLLTDITSTGSGWGQGPLACSCENSNEPSGPIKCRECLAYPRK